MFESVSRIARKAAQWLPAVAIFAAFIGLWQLAVSFLGLREYLLPSPMSVWRAMSGNEIPWVGHIWVTALEIVGAFVLAGVAGVVLGVAIAWSATIARALTPFLVFVNTLPKVAIAPLFLMWMGYGILPNILIGALIGFFPVVINTSVGLTQIDQDLVDLGRVFNAPKWKVFMKIRVPNAYPYILSAPRFHALIFPSRSWTVIASLESMTTAAKRRKFASSRLRSVMSRSVVAIPTGLPASSTNLVTVIQTSNVRPSFVMRWVSKEGTSTFSSNTRFIKSNVSCRLASGMVS